MPYVNGDWNVICDRCGFKKLASECRKTWDHLFVCKDTCWEPRHPQDFVRAKADRQSVPIARPDIEQTMGTTTIKVEGSKDDTTIDVISISGLSDKDGIGVTLDDGSIFWTFINGTPAGDTIPLNNGLWGVASVGNTVLLPSISKETGI